MYQYHVREYTMSEILALLREAGFGVVKAYYSMVNDLTFIDDNPEERLKISSFKGMARIALKKPTKLNILRLLAHPIVKIRPSPRQLIVFISMKAREPAMRTRERWG
jgi:hypothetical protein